MIAWLSLLLTLAGSPGDLQLYEASSAEIDSLLFDTKWATLSVEGKLARLAELRIGTPYSLGCLGEGREPDTDPIFRLDRADCTVLVVTNAALLHARTLEESERVMAEVHYRDGEPSYDNRYHFTCDRILSSPYFEEITHLVAPDSLLESATVHLNRTDSGERLLPLDWERVVSMRYLPVSRLNARLLSGLPAVCGVAFVRMETMKRGFLISHEGILLGGQILHHASSQAGQVVETPLLQYLNVGEGEPTFDGVVFYRFL